MKRVAIIGSGFGGLAAAIRLQSSGVETEIFEALDKAGGRAYVYEQDGFKFDGGPTVITAPACLEELFTIAGRSMKDYVEMLEVKPFYRLQWEDGQTIDYTPGEMLRDQIARFFPEDKDGYEAFIKYTDDVYSKGYEGLASEAFLNFTDMVRVAPELAKLRADRNVYSTVSRFVKSDYLRQALSFHSLLVGGNPFETSAIYTLIHSLERRFGVYFPKGGTGSLVSGLVKLYEELGGKLHLNSPVDKIELVDVEKENPSLFDIFSKNRQKHRVYCGKESKLFDAVVSNADIHQTYSRLYRSTPSANMMKKKLEKSDWSMSLFVLYFGTDKPYDDLAHHTVLFAKRYQELLKEIFHGHDIPEDFSLYLHAPCVTDPSMAPEGKGSYYVLAPVPHLGNADVDWSTFGHEYADKILEYLEMVMPDLRTHICTKFWIGPEDFKKRYGAYHGSAFSLAPSLKQSAYFRPHNQDKSISGLFLAGAGTHPGAGVPGVVNSAKATAKLVEDYLGNIPS